MTERTERTAGGPDRPDRVRRSGPGPGRSTDRVLPDVSTDETDIGWGDLPDEPGGDDERILREVPPHHVG